MVSVIIVTHNNQRFLKDCLNSVFGQTYKDIEAMLVFNASWPSAIQDVRRSFPRLNLIINDENLLFCRAFNQGIDKSQGEYALCLNDDVILESDFVEALVEAANMDQRIGMVSGKILRMDQVTLDSTGLFLGKSRIPLERGFNRQDSGQYNKAEYVFGVSGCAAFYRRIMLEDIKDKYGYFDERFGIFYEDLDLSWRANKKGWKGYYVPRAIAYHQRGATVKIGRPALNFFRKYNFSYLSDELKARLIKNRYMTIGKNDSCRGFIFHLPFILLYEIRIYLYLLFFSPRLLVKLAQSKVAKPKKPAMESSQADNSITSITISGDSMFPAIQDGNRVIVKSIDYRQARIGDVLAYERRPDKNIIVHRLVKKLRRGEQEFFITQGDANSSYCSDGAIDPRRRLLSKVVAIVKKDAIIDMENNFMRFTGYFKALLLWYTPFLILPQRKIKKALTSPALIPQEMVKNITSLINRCRIKIL